MSADILDRLVDIMRHFYCEEPSELEQLLGLPRRSLVSLFRYGVPHGVPVRVAEALYAAGIRRDFLARGEGSMLRDSPTAVDTAVLRGHVCRLLELIVCRREEEGGCGGAVLHVTDRKKSSASVDRELIELLVEVLSEKTTRERLVEFIRREAANRCATRR